MRDLYRSRGKLMSIPTVTGRSSRRLSGFDYVLGKPVERTAAEWRQRLRELVAHGGHRRVDHGETFGHGRGALIEFEIYGNVK